MMIKHIVGKEKTVTLTSEQRFSTATENISTVAHAYLPTFLEDVDGNVCEPFSMDVVLEKATEQKITWSEDRIVYSDNFTEIFPFEVFHVIYAQLRRKFLVNSIFSAHSVVVTRGDEVTMLVGHSGTGKTTMMLELVEKYGYEVLSTNKTLIQKTEDGLMCIGGTKSITHNINDQEIVGANNTKNFTYWDRTVSPGKKPTDNRAVPITCIAIVHLNDGVEVCEEIHMPSALHKLYPYFFDLIGADIIGVNGDVIYDGQLEKDTKQKNTRTLAGALSDIAVYRISGSKKFISKSIGEK